MHYHVKVITIAYCLLIEWIMHQHNASLISLLRMIFILLGEREAAALCRLVAVLHHSSILVLIHL